jgi:hypothetical protein
MDVYRMLAERQVVVPLWWLILRFQKKKKNLVVTGGAEMSRAGAQIPSKFLWQN